MSKVSKTPVIVEEKPTEVTPEPIFQPTPHMIVWLDAALKSETDEIAVIAKNCNMSRNSWYRWVRNPKFIEWFDAEWDKKIKSYAWKLDAIGMKNAKRDYNYWKAMQHRVGNTVEESKSSSATVGVKDGDKEIVVKIEDYK